MVVVKRPHPNLRPSPPLLHIVPPTRTHAAQRAGERPFSRCQAGPGARGRTQGQDWPTTAWGPSLAPCHRVLRSSGTAPRSPRACMCHASVLCCTHAHSTGLLHTRTQHFGVPPMCSHPRHAKMVLSVFCVSVCQCTQQDCFVSLFYLGRLSST